jgi:NADH dehydrogenase
VIIVGAGFGGISAVKALRHVPVDMTLVDRQNYYLFPPLLYQVASGLLDPSEIAAPIRKVVRRAHNADVRLAEVTSVDIAARRVHTSTGSLDYDMLVIAAGSVDNYYGISHLEERANGLKTLPQALRLRAAVLRAFEAATTASGDERRRLLSFAIVGGGPTGVEYSGALAELVRHVLVKDYRRLDFDEVSITLVEGTDQVLGTFSPRLGRKAARALARKGVKLLLKRSVRDVTEGGLVLDDGGLLNAGTVVWTAGVRAAPLMHRLGVPVSKQGQVAVTSSLCLDGHPEVFVIGDGAELLQDGDLLPMLAPVAIQQGQHVARVITARLNGRSDPPFHYRNKGTMATVGRGTAVAELGPIRINGFIGWLMWLGLHLLYIVGFRSRAVVLLSWGWNFLLMDRPVRLIVDPGEAPAASSNIAGVEQPHMLDEDGKTTPGH